ncbi:hypothetical protein ACKKBG_A05075 [Auxenochlorella protothecoides x Auxenochlorella symbiontica]
MFTYGRARVMRNDPKVAIAAILVFLLSLSSFVAFFALRGAQGTATEVRRELKQSRVQTKKVLDLTAKLSKEAEELRIERDQLLELKKTAMANAAALNETIQKANLANEQLRMELKTLEMERRAAETTARQAQTELRAAQDGTASALASVAACQGRLQTSMADTAAAGREAQRSQAGGGGGSDEADAGGARLADAGAGAGRGAALADGAGLSARHALPSPQPLAMQA